MRSATIDPRGNAPSANFNALQYGPIVVATDSSTGSDAALQAAGRLATLHKSKVVVVSFVEPLAYNLPRLGLVPRLTPGCVA